MTYAVSLERPDDLAEFRDAACKLLAAGIAPHDVIWDSEQTPTLFNEPLPTNQKTVSVPRAFADLAQTIICHRNEQRYGLLYQALWRLDQGERSLMQHAADPLLHQLRRMEAAVRHDQHRMTAFLRFREITAPEGTRFIAWYEPQHRILRRAAAFFIDRFTTMRFSILTPDLTLHWNTQEAQFSPGLRPQDAASGDAVEDWWRRYYAAIFNPARINARLMQSHMPKRFWGNLPEAKIIQELIEQAAARTDRMIQPHPLPSTARPERSPPIPCSSRNLHTKPPDADDPYAMHPLRSGNPDTPARRQR
jgi:probable DNA metabolism protein